MSRYFAWIHTLAMVLGLVFTIPALAFEVPPLTRSVEDLVGVLSPGDRQQLESVLRQAAQSGQIQLQVLIVPTLDGLPIEQASLQIVDKWKLGSREKDNGVLFLIAVNDKKMRIEVGQGLEGDIPDVIAKRILADRVAPFFKRRQMDLGIRAGVEAILAAAHVQVDSSFATSESSDLTLPLPAVPIWFFILIIISVLISIFSGPRGRGRGGGGGVSMSSGGWGSGNSWGSSSGWGSSGGGWSGGGGGFSGGGASSDW